MLPKIKSTQNIKTTNEARLNHINSEQFRAIPSNSEQKHKTTFKKRKWNTKAKQNQQMSLEAKCATNIKEKQKTNRK